MSFKKKTTYIKQECEYHSADGEVYDISVIKHGDRTYIQWSLHVFEKTSGEESPPSQAVIIDGPMLEGLYNLYQEMVAPKSAKTSRTALKRPNITDHRSGLSIQQSVKETMRNYDDNVSPIQSFSADIDAMNIASQEIGETPSEWSLTNINDDWKQDAINRKGASRPSYKERGSSGLKFKRVGANDIM